MHDETLIGREFVHFKGGHYRLEGFAKDSETLEDMVVYRALYGRLGLDFDGVATGDSLLNDRLHPF